MRLALSALIASTLLVWGCAAPAPIPVPTTPPGSTLPPTASSSAVAPSPVALSSPSPSTRGQAARDAALKDAADHLGINQSQLTVDQMQEKEWSDASLGCPRQGVLYAQVITPGFLIVISGAGKQLEYHTDERGRAVLCAER